GGGGGGCAGGGGVRGGGGLGGGGRARIGGGGRALSPGRMELSGRPWQWGLLAEPAPGAAPRRSPRAAFPSPGPRPRPATLTRRLRRSGTEGNGGRKAATHLDHAHPPHALALAHECPRQIVEHSLPGVP